MKPDEAPPPAADATAGYAAGLRWLDRLIEREIIRLRARYELSLDELRGLYISDQQVDDLLARGHESGNESGNGSVEHRQEEEDGPLAGLGREAAALRAQAGPATPLRELAARLGLGEAEHDVLLLALAPELDLKYETLYGYLNNDIARRQLTADLALRLLRDGGAPADRALLAPGGRLFELGLLEAIDSGDRRTLLAQPLALSPTAAQALLGLPIRDPRLPATPELPAGIDDTLLPPAARAFVRDFADRHPPGPGLIVCTGEAAAEQLAAVRLYAARHRHAVLAVALAALAGDTAWAQTCSRLRSVAALARALVVVYDDIDCFPREPAPLLQLTRQVRDLVGAGVPLVWAVPADAPWANAVADLPFIELNLPAADSDDRAACWPAALTRRGLSADAHDVTTLAERFALPCSRIAAAAQAALGAADNDPDRLRSALWQAARRHSGHSLAELASRVAKSHTWTQLVLPDTTLRQVKEVAAAIGQRDRVYRRWRMAERTGRGDGLMLLFTGASGTGKTMTASVVANDLGLDLYRIDLAAVVSKYIGETEKNLDRIFRAARRSNAILFFDEADALLGKRSEVKDAHDRHANIEVAYLLQKMEEHDGVVILSSNLPKNMDQAFSRRMHYVVEFPRPDAPLRERLWRGMFPPQVPLAGDVDFRFLAGQFEISGGEIQTVALDAAFLASADDTPIGMPHLVKAMARNQLKQGNPGGMSDFRQYHGLSRRS